MTKPVSALSPLVSQRSTQPVSKPFKRTLKGHEIQNGELLVKLKPGTEFSLLQDFASEYGATLVEKFDIPESIYQSFGGELIRVKLPAGIEVPEALVAMREDGRVLYAEPNDVIRLDKPVSENEDGDGQEPITGTPNDLHQDLWGLNNEGQTGGTAGADISAKEAWEVTTGSRENGPLIAVIDTGVDYSHPDLDANVWTNPGEIPGDGIDNDENGVIDDVRGYNAYADNGDPMDGHSHGTHCAGTIAGVGNNGQGVVGVNWEANILPVKIFSDSGRTSADAIVRGVLYAAARMGADITSNSWGGGRPNDAIRDAFASSNALHIAAAGNNGMNTDRRPFYPMGYDLPNIVSVAATDHNDARASFSNYGVESVDVAAPGKDILSTINGGEYASYSGTSMATPHVSGVAALLKNAHPEASNQELKERLIYSSDKSDGLTSVSASGGRVNAALALENDTVAPAAPNDLASVEANSRGVTLGWTASADDGWCGNSASAYEVRMSDQAISLDNFANASHITADAPAFTGNLEQLHMAFEPSLEERTVHVGMRVVDNVGNRSDLRTASITVPAAQLSFGDAFDAEETAWTPEGDWARVAVEGRGMVWTDSPEGNYGDELNMSLTSPAISLAETTNALLTFEAKHEYQWGDKARVEVSEDGENWTTVETVQRNSDWTGYSVDLSDYDGKDVQLRFRVETNGARNADGLMLDNLMILGD